MGTHAGVLPCARHFSLLVLRSLLFLLSYQRCIGQGVILYEDVRKFVPMKRDGGSSDTLNNSVRFVVDADEMAQPARYRRSRTGATTAEPAAFVLKTAHIKDDTDPKNPHDPLNQADNEIDVLTQLNGDAFPYISELDERYASWIKLNRPPRRTANPRQVLVKYIEGETLANFVDERPADERFAAKVMAFLVIQTKMLHELYGYVYHDHKPENVMVRVNDAGDLIGVWLIDFGMAERQNAWGRAQNLYGSLPSIAPEMVILSVAPEKATVKDHDYRVDIWSLGVVLFEVVNGLDSPFNRPGYSVTEVLQAIMKVNYKFPRHFSSGLKSLLRRILVFRPEDRPTFDEILADPWFEQSGIHVNDVIEQLKEDHMRRKRALKPSQRNEKSSHRIVTALNQLAEYLQKAAQNNVRPSQESSRRQSDISSRRISPKRTPVSPTKTMKTRQMSARRKSISPATILRQAKAGLRPTKDTDSSGEGDRGSARRQAPSPRTKGSTRGNRSPTPAQTPSPLSTGPKASTPTPRAITPTPRAPKRGSESPTGPNDVSFSDNERELKKQKKNDSMTERVNKMITRRHREVKFYRLQSANILPMARPSGYLSGRRNA